MGDSSEKMKITGLNIDCLENVFEYLEFCDLLNAASSNKRLNKAANFVYVREYAGKVYFENKHLPRGRSFEISRSSITIQDLKISLQFLRCFGHLVYEINFESSAQKSRKLEQHVINYINEYCSGTLKSINIVNYHNLRPIEWKLLKKQFSKVEQVTFSGWNNADKEFFNRLFPKMKTLEVTFGGGLSPLFFVNANNFANLEQLHIIDLGRNLSTLCGRTMAPILRLNPQLVNLQIYSHQPLFDSNDFQNAIKSLHNLETLDLVVETLSTNSIGSVICLNKVKTLTLHLLNQNNIVEIPFLFGQLHTLSLSFYDQLLAEFFNFIDKHPTIQDLTLGVPNLSVMDQSKIAKSLPSLDSVTFDGYRISANEAIHFMSNFENLRKFVFDINDTTTYVDFQARLSTEWDCKINKCGMISVNRVAPEPRKNTRLDIMTFRYD